MTLAEGCYANMFFGCSSLSYIKCPAITATKTYIGQFGWYCSNHRWVEGVAQSGYFELDSDAEFWFESPWNDNYNGIPTGWTVQNA